MTQPAPSPSSLLALARTRRMQRALAHAQLNRHAPMPTLRSSLGYVLTTARVTPDAARGAGAPARAGRAPAPAPDATAHHQMTVLGVARREGVAYVVEEVGADEAPLVYRLWLRGPRQGYLVPLHAWYEHGASPPQVRARLAALAPSLGPVEPRAREAWMLSTRVIQRRALRLAGPGSHADPPIRSFALQLVVEPVRADGGSGKTTVTAFLRPDARLVDVVAIPGTDQAIARLAYVGVPRGLGLTKHTVVLLTAGLGDP